ncbi:MAG: hypothetical protein Q8O03_05670 [Nanoarchaeota archaeon]|nr:hypothetical protein [Nanoarchaeota archaeon]
MNDIKFIRDDVQEEKIKQLKEILDILSTKPKDSDVEAAKRFFYSVLKATREVEEQKREEIEKEKKIREIERKKPPKPIIPLRPSIMPKEFEETEEIPIPRPEATRIPMPSPAPDVTKIPKPEISQQEEPKIDDVITSINQSYPLILYKNFKGEAIVSTNISRKEGKIIYELTEPEIDFRLVTETEKLVQKDFQKDKKILKDEKFLTDKIKKAFKNLKIDYTEEYKEEIKYYVYKHMLGLERIDPLIHDHNINTIICDGLNKPVKITLGPGLEVTTNITYTKKEELDEQVKRLGVRIRNEISENNPTAEGMFYNFKIQLTFGMGEADSKFIIKRMP